MPLAGERSSSIVVVPSIRSIYGPGRARHDRRGAHRWHIDGIEGIDGNRRACAINVQSPGDSLDRRIERRRGASALIPQGRDRRAPVPDRNGELGFPVPPELFDQLRPADAGLTPILAPGLVPFSFTSDHNPQSFLPQDHQNHSW
jgi:hypothetical protein